MALDAQRNWSVSMAENLEQVKRSSGRSGTLQPDPQTVKPPSPPLAWHGDPIYLPDEIIYAILEYIKDLPQPHAALQSTLASCCRLSRQWYAVTVPFLYDHPYLYGTNYDPFMRTICPSINLHVRPSPLADLVRILDLSKLVHQGSKSLTARLLGRTKKRLQEFIAPQASFAVNCLPALSKCRQLLLLDLSLVSESPPLPELFKTVSHLAHLRTFRLPRSSGFGSNGPLPSADALLPWPPSLEDINLSGGIDAHFIHGIVSFPSTLRRLTIERCPAAKGFAIMHLLRTTVRPLPLLDDLKLAHLPRLRSNALDDLLFLLPGLRKLSISVDYITGSLFDLDTAAQTATFARLAAEHQSNSFSPSHSFTEPFDPPSPSLHRLPSDANPHANLQILELTNSGNPGDSEKLTPIDILMPVDDGTLPFLRQVWVARSLRWREGEGSFDSEALGDALKERGKLLGEGKEAGLWEFRDTI